jgi:hypothetical protein
MKLMYRWLSMYLECLSMMTAKMIFGKRHGDEALGETGKSWRKD